MRTIWKYGIDLLKDLSVDDTISIEMPIGSKILYVDCQSPNVLSFWAEVDSLKVHADMTEIRRFRVFGTGQTIPEMRVKYVGTVLDGEFVWHLYEWV